MPGPSVFEHANREDHQNAELRFVAPATSASGSAWGAIYWAGACDAGAVPGGPVRSARLYPMAMEPTVFGGAETQTAFSVAGGDATLKENGGGYTLQGRSGDVSS